MIKIYTDGSAKGNPGNGGYGVVMRFNEKEKEMSQGYRMTTNNRMELLAVIVALKNGYLLGRKRILKERKMLIYGSVT